MKTKTLSTVAAYPASLNRRLQRTLAAFAALLLAACASSPSAIAQAQGKGPRAGSRGGPSGELLSPELRAIIEDPKYADSSWGVHVVDLETGEVIYSLNPLEKFLTASTAKIFSVTTALSKLGSEYTFKTPVHHTGSRNGATVVGDLILKGVGDLTLGGRTKPDGTIDIPIFDHYDANALPGMATITPEDPLAGLDELAQQVKDAGVTHVAGDVVVDDRLWQPIEKDEVPISPIAVNDNLIDIVLTPAAAGSPATFDWRPKTTMFTLDVDVTTGAAGSPIQVEITTPAPGQIRVRGSVPAGFAIPIVQTYQVPEPAAFARTLFIEALARAGVTVAASPLGENPAEKLPRRDGVDALPKLAEFTSPPFRETAKLINKVSHNLGANMLPPLFAALVGKQTYEAGMAIERAFVRAAGIDPALFTLKDGQGLPPNQVAPKGQTDYLRWLPSLPEFPEFFDSTPVLGIDGSLATVVPPGDPAIGHVYAKTGTLVGLEGGQLTLLTKALAGYIDAASGRRLAFAIYVNGLAIQEIQDVIEANNTLGHMSSLIYQAQ